jgi:glycine/serine hydroxymethyltransferase
MCDVMDDVENVDIQTRVKAEVVELCNRFPVYK